MEAKEIKMLTNYFQIYRQLNNRHADAAEFEKFKAWAEIETGVHAIFEAFEDFYTKLDGELQSQGIKDAVLDESFDPATLANPQPIIDVVKSTIASKEAGGKFLGSLGGNWSRQRLALNNIDLHYNMMQLAEKYKDNPEYKILEVLEGFIITYNESMGSLTDLMNSRFDRVDEKHVEISDKLTQLVGDVATITEKTKDVPLLIETVNNLTETVKGVAENAEKVNQALEILGKIQGSIDTLKDDIVRDVGTSIDEKLAAFKVALLEEIRNLLDEREKKKMSKFGNFLKKNWERVTAGAVILGLGLGMGHFIAVSSNRSGDLAELQNEAYAIYETYYGEGSAADMSLEDVLAALKGLQTEQHSQDDMDKIAGYDQAVADKEAAETKYNELMGKLSAEYEKTNGQGSAEGKSIEELLAGIAKDGGNIQTYEAEIVALYDTLFPNGDAQNLEEMLAELNGASIKTEEDEVKIAEYDEVVSAIASTYTEVTGGDPTGLSVDAMLDAIAAAIQNAGDTVYGRAIMLQLYQNVMHESGEQYSDEELYKWVCQFYDLDETYIENDGLDSFEPDKQ